MEPVQCAYLRDVTGLIVSHYLLSQVYAVLCYIGVRVENIVRQPQVRCRVFYVTHYWRNRVHYNILWLENIIRPENKMRTYMEFKTFFVPDMKTTDHVKAAQEIVKMSTIQTIQ